MQYLFVKQSKNTYNKKNTITKITIRVLSNILKRALDILLDSL